MSSWTRHKRLSAAAGVGLALALLGGAPAVAPAAEPGVIVDPGSPAAKEYAIPLEKARQDAGGGSSSKSSGQSSDGQAQHAQPFGEGISSGSQSSTPKTSRPAKRKAPTRTRRARQTPPRPPVPPAAAEDTSLASASAGSGTGWTLGIVFGVLVLGAGLGITLRRLSRRQAP